MTDTATDKPSSNKSKPIHAIVRDFLGRPASSETLGQRVILQYYASRANRQGQFNPGYELIHRDTGLGRTTIDKANKHFKSLGILDWKKGWGNRATGANKGQSNLYALDPKALTARMSQAYVLGILALMVLHGVALPPENSSTTTLGSSTTTLGSSTTTVVEPKSKHVRASLVEEQANKRASLKESENQKAGRSFFEDVNPSQVGHDAKRDNAIFIATAQPQESTQSGTSVANVNNTPNAPEKLYWSRGKAFTFTAPETWTEKLTSRQLDYYGNPADRAIILELTR
jgi:hypothetical protein